MKDERKVFMSRKDLVDEARNLRQIYGPRYRTNVDTYLFLLEIKKDKGIAPLSPLSKSVLAEYPQVEFLAISSDDIAESILSELDAEEIVNLIEEIREAIESYVYVTLMNKIKDYQYQIHSYENRKTHSYFDPGCRHSFSYNRVVRKIKNGR